MVRATKVRLENGEERDVLELDFETQQEDAVTYKGDSIIFDPKLMASGVPQVFKFMDRYMAVIRAEDDSLDFYHFPDPDDDEAPE